MSYKMQPDGSVQRLADGAFVPASMDNRDWQEFQAWLADGNTAQAADPAPARPTQRQAMDHRMSANLLFRALVRATAQELGLTPAAFVAKIKAQLP